MARYEIVFANAEQWDELKYDAYKLTFKEVLPKDCGRADFALLIIDMTASAIVGFVSCRKVSESVVYWQYGGVTDELRNKTSVLTLYLKFIENMKNMGFKKIYTYVYNDNIRYLKLCLTSGFLIVGTRNDNGKVMLDLTKEL